MSVVFPVTPDVRFRRYTASAAQTAFAVPFPFQNGLDIAVLKILLDGSQQLLVQPTQFTVSGAGNPAGGTVTLISGALAGEIYVVIGAAIMDRVLSIVRNGKFQSGPIDDDLDRALLRDLELAREVGRAVKVGYGQTAVELPLPAAGNALGWSEDETQLVNLPDLGISISAALQAAINAAMYDPTLRFKTVALLKASTKPATVAGTLWQAAGFLYTEAAANAVDHHLTTAGGVKLYVVNGEDVTVEAFGAALAGSDESTIAQMMVNATGVLRVPRGKTLVCKNVTLVSGNRVDVKGTLKLPNACADYDRLLFAIDQTDIIVDIAKIDGNDANQSGVLGTHLIYFVRVDNSFVKVARSETHYVHSGATMPDTGGNGRNTSSGAYFFNVCSNTSVDIGFINGWSREAVYLLDCLKCTVRLGHAQGGTTNREYSGLQVSGSFNKVIYASVDNAGASGVGFDTIKGVLSNVVATNTRENHGVNIGHPGRPADDSVLSNITVDGATRSGICIQSSTQRLEISNFTIQNAGEYGLRMSDSSDLVRLSNGVIKHSGLMNYLTGGTGAELTISNVRSDVVDPQVLHMITVTGSYAVGETVTGPAGTGVVRKVVKNLTGASQCVFLSSKTGTFTAGQTVTGGTSGASGTIDALALAPSQYNEATGSIIVDDTRQIVPAASAGGVYLRHRDGTAEWWGTITIAGTANTDTSGTLNFDAGLWASAPMVQATLTIAASTNAHTVAKLRASSTTTVLTAVINASSAQNYGIALYARGKWK